MGKINIKVCVGTACHVMGGSQILEELQKLGRTTLNGIIEVSAMVCSKECYGKAEAVPVVHINDKTVFEASVDKVLEEIRKLQGR